MGQVENKSENGRFKSNYINNSLNIGQQTPHQKKKTKTKNQAWENTYCISHLYKVTEEEKLRKRVTDCLGPRV